MQLQKNEEGLILNFKLRFGKASANLLGIPNNSAGGDFDEKGKEKRTECVA